MFSYSSNITSCFVWFEIWSLTLRQYKLQMSENKVLGKIFEQKMK